ncbi:MAG: type II toxin-antitoxin system HigB family toxin [Candidatus Thiodiazotropha sp. (ex Lucinoma kastoroae)]|nr:type II toxin-antitoxin system HigB family toxin [Candidatus Thiodiazotropha sp. (ex Lucinoma kastoroae)]
MSVHDGPEYAARDSNWSNTHDIKNRYRSADFLANNRVIFNIKGNKYRLVVKIRFAGNVVLIEWVGTHAEYSKKRF